MWDHYSTHTQLQKSIRPKLGNLTLCTAVVIGMVSAKLWTINYKNYKTLQQGELSNLVMMLVRVFFWTCLDGIGFRLAEQNKRKLSCSKRLTSTCPLTCKICSLSMTFTTISVALRTSYMYPDQELTILKWSLGYSGAVLWNGLPSELRKPLTLKRFKKGINDLYSSTGTNTANT